MTAAIFGLVDVIVGGLLGRPVDPQTATASAPRAVIGPPVAQDALSDVPDHPSGLLFVTPGGKQWTASLHHRYWTKLRLLADRAGFDFYELRHAGATMLLERGSTPWNVAVQLGHTDGGRLVQELYGHPREDAARARLLAVWGEDIAPLEAVASR